MPSRTRRSLRTARPSVCERTPHSNRKVLLSENVPSGKASRNSQPSEPSPWIECGIPAGKYRRSRWVTSRDQPPSCKFMCASAKENRKFGTNPLSVDGGTKTSGFSAFRVDPAGRYQCRPLLFDRFGHRFGSCRTALACGAPATAAVPVSRTDLRLIEFVCFSRDCSKGSDTRSSLQFVGFGGLLLSIDDGFHDGNAR